MDKLPPLGHAISGAVGAVVALTATYPLDVIKTRQQASDYLSRWDEMFNGLGSAVLGTATSNFAYFYYYFALRSGLQGNRRGAWVSLVFSAVAAALTQITTLPVLYY